MNAFDYFFEDRGNLNKDFILNKGNSESFKNIHDNAVKLSDFITEKYGENNNILLISFNSSFFIIAYLAIIRSGNICIPLSPETESENLKYIVNFTESKIAFVQLSVSKKFEFPKIDLFSEDVLKQTSANSNIINTSKNFDENRAAEIIFTSGSTGIPKGVVLSHKNLISNTESIISYLKLTQNDIILVVLPFYYCYGLSLLHTHLRVGGSIVLNNSFMLLGGILNDLKNYKCTGFAGVPSHFQILLRKSTTFKNSNFPDLKYVTQAGGKLHNVFIEEFIHSYPEIKFFVMYGQTEATARLSFLPPHLTKIKMGSIGKGIPGVTLKVVDEKNQIVRKDETGEIIAKGDNVMLGYYKDEKETKNIIRDGWLYTGDIGTIDDEGYIYLTARKKEIFKVRGKRISPKEIEEVILSIPGVVDCSIEAVENQLWGETIKAVITVNNSAEEKTNIEKIKQFCSKHLASHKVPQIIEVLDKVRITATGKKPKK